MRNGKSETRNAQKPHDIVVRSPEMRRLLETCIPHLSDYFSDKDRGVVFTTPFKPLFFHWQRIENALCDDQQGVFVNMHAKLLYSTLKKIYDAEFSKWKEMTDVGQITCGLLWTLFPPGTPLVSGSGNDMVMSKAVQAEPIPKAGCTVFIKFVEWDGKRYGWTHQASTIDNFKGRRKIAELSIYPLKYHDQEKRTFKDLAKRGRRFASLTSSQPKIVAYQGSYDLDGDSGQSWFRSRRKVKVGVRACCMNQPDFCISRSQSV